MAEIQWTRDWASELQSSTNTAVKQSRSGGATSDMVCVSNE
jgi:hypothetical protein